MTAVLPGMSTDIRMENEMPKYTVIGLYDSTGEVYCDHFEAESPGDAMRQAAKAAEIDANEYDLNILGAFEGTHVITCACEDSGYSAMACDLLLPDGDEEADSGDDLCDYCMKSGVQISYTDDSGKTVCHECFVAQQCPTLDAKGEPNGI